jgi:hypothetical protein
VLLAAPEPLNTIAALAGAVAREIAMANNRVAKTVLDRVVLRYFILLGAFLQRLISLIAWKKDFVY